MNTDNFPWQQTIHLQTRSCLCMHSSFLVCWGWPCLYNRTPYIVKTSVDAGHPGGEPEQAVEYHMNG